MVKLKKKVPPCLEGENKTSKKGPLPSCDDVVSFFVEFAEFASNHNDLIYTKVLILYLFEAIIHGNVTRKAMTAYVETQDFMKTTPVSPVVKYQNGK